MARDKRPVLILDISRFLVILYYEIVITVARLVNRQTHGEDAPLAAILAVLSGYDSMMQLYKTSAQVKTDPESPMRGLTLLSTLIETLKYAGCCLSVESDAGVSDTDLN